MSNRCAPGQLLYEARVIFFQTQILVLVVTQEESHSVMDVLVTHHVVRISIFKSSSQNKDATDSANRYAQE